MRRRPSRFGILVAGLVLAACVGTENPTAPGRRGELPSVQADWTPGPLGSYTLATPPYNDIITPYNSTAITVPAGAPARITITGFVSFSVNPDYVTCWGSPPPPPPGGFWSVGPAGFANSPWYWRVHVLRSSQPSDEISLSPLNDPGAGSTTGYVQGPATIYAGRPVALPGACGNPQIPYAPMYTVSGSQTVSVEALDSAHVDPTPNASAVPPGDTVSYTIRVDWDPTFTVTGFWVWVSDTTTNNSTIVGNCARQKTCRVVVRERGHVEVNGIATLGGSLNSRSAVMGIEPPPFQVTAAPVSIAGPQPVTFTASVNAPIEWALASWTWRPDNGTGGISPSNCTVSEKTCTRTISKSGWMKATTVIGPYTLSDSVHVSVVPCLTQDSLLDDSRIRNALNDALNATNLNGSPWDRRERGGARIRRPDGSILDTLFEIGSNDTPCSFDFASRHLGNIGTPIVVWHTHPFTPQDPADPLPYDVNSVPHSNCPQFATAPPPPPGKVYAAKPGPSIPNDTQGGIWQIVVEKNGSVWLVDPSGAFTEFPRNQPGKCDPLSM